MLGQRPTATAYDVDFATALISHPLSILYSGPTDSDSSTMHSRYLLRVALWYMLVGSGGTPIPVLCVWFPAQCVVRRLLSCRDWYSNSIIYPRICYEVYNEL